MLNHVLPGFEIKKESLFTDSSDESLWRIFESVIYNQSLGTIYCVIDGLDECDETSLEFLLRRFEALFSTKINDSLSCRIKLIAVSRDFPDFITEIFSSFPRILLDADTCREVNQDINRYIDVEVNALASYRDYPDLLRLM